MVSNFHKALYFVLKWEGGYVNNPSDFGGETNKGITQATYNKLRIRLGINTQSVKKITDKEVESIYNNMYWLASGCDKLPEKLAMVHFNAAVNMGVKRANSFLQQCNNSTDKYLTLQEAKYREFAKVKGQEVFLKGWLNRLNDLRKTING